MTHPEFRLACLYRVPSGAIVKVLEIHKPHKAFLTLRVQVVAGFPKEAATIFDATNPEGWERINSAEADDGTLYRVYRIPFGGRRWRDGGHFVIKVGRAGCRSWHESGPSYPTKEECIVAFEKRLPNTAKWCAPILRAL